MATQSIQQLRKIVWAADALTSDPKLRSRLLEGLRALARSSAGKPVEIEPVYVLSPDQLRIPGEISTDSVAHFESLATKELDELVASARLPALRPPRILVQTYPSLRGAVRLLINHAIKTGADAIVVATHSREGLSRAVLGSFAETLVFQSEIPVFVVNSHAGPIQKLNHVFVPTDYSPASESVFRQAVAFLKDREPGQARVTLFHNVVETPPPRFRSGVFGSGGDWMELRAMVDRYRDNVEALNGEWKKWAESQGVRVDADVYEGPEDDLAESIVQGARRAKADCIVMGTNVEPLGGILLGSVARKVIRASEEPVFVLHPAAAGAKRQSGVKARVKAVARQVKKKLTKKTSKKTSKKVSKKKTAKKAGRSKRK